MRYQIKTVRGRTQVTDYTLHGDTNDLARAVRELEGKGEVVVTAKASTVSMSGHTYAGGNARRK
jgi:hypothetical protein